MVSKNEIGRGGGKYLKKPLKSKDYFSKILSKIKYFSQLFIKKVKNFCKKLTFAAYDRIGEGGARATRRFCNLLSLIREFRADLKFNLLNSKGSILIEFAVCMPVLIILLYYINDLSKLKRYYDQTEFVAQQFINIIQNISQNRTDKKINQNDVKYAATLAHLTIYPGKTMFSDGKRGKFSHELSHMPYFFINYVRGLSEGKASVLWSYYCFCYGAVNPTGWQIGDNKGGYSNYSVVKRKTNVDPAEIYPTLKVNEGEDKIIIECPLFCREHTMSLGAYAASDNQDTRAKKAFNCRLATPKASYKENLFGFYFPSVIIFTPKKGLFDETGLN